ncbi:hypothetical protein [Hephaestia mangrovi]|uniref:hypothetical protein n=1 Tax=Hephaestia mangrovi TaxID=2873268 RepID=UPI001CA67038|nr:hypothetical protein [Hephaestia mangrovi]MBY8828395.1 hypothetical protein [Hephaestia mangrovi]
MNKGFVAAAAAVALSFGVTMSAAAQDLPFSYGDYWEVSEISVDDGGNAQYIDFLASQWKKSQEFAKSKGWISEYHVLANLNKRPGEADYYLITQFSHMPDAAEAAARDKAYTDYMQSSMRQMEAASGDRAKYRHVMGSELLGEVLLK